MGELGAPVSYTPLSQQGKSLESGVLTAKLGLATNIASLSRSADQCRVLNNFQMFVRDIWTNQGIGWLPQRPGAFNGGNPFLDFGNFSDNSGNDALLFQVADKLYSYNFGSSTETTLTTGLNTTALPCIRQAYSPQTALSVSIYCNGNSQPQKVTATNALSPLLFNTGKTASQVTVGGSIVPTQQLALSISGSGLVNSPTTVTYTLATNDTVATAAAGLANAINNTASLAGVGISATSSGAVITINSPTTLTLSYSTGLKVETATVAGTAAAGQQLTVTATLPNTQVLTVGGTVTVGNQLSCIFTSVSITGSPLTVTPAAAGAADTVTTLATALAAAINANANIAAAGITAASNGNQVTVSYPTAVTLALTPSATGTLTLVQTQGPVSGATVSAQYTQVTGDTNNSSAAGLAAAINSVVQMVGAGITATVATNVVSINYPAVLSISWSKTVTGTATLTLAAGTSANAGTLNVVTNTLTSTWPGTFNNKTYSAPKFCTPFLDRFVYGGFSANPFDILISKQGDPESFPQSTPQLATDAGVFTYPASLGKLTALTHLRLNNQSSTEIVIGGCTKGVFMIQGTTALDFNMQVLTRSFGIPSNRAIIEVGNNLIFLSSKGFRQFSSLANNATLINDTLSFLIQDLVNLIDVTAWQNAHAVHHPDTQEIWFWVPLVGDGGNCKHAFILNYNNPASSGGNIVPIWSTRDGTAVACSTYFNGVKYAGGYDGLLQQWYQGSLYNTAPINSQISTALFSVGNVNQKCSIRNLSVITDGGNQQFSIRANMYQKLSGVGGAVKWQKVVAPPYTSVLSSQAGATTALGSWVLGVGAFPSNHIKIVDYQPSGNAQFWDTDILTTNVGDALDYYGLAYTLSGGGFER